MALSDSGLVTGQVTEIVTDGIVSGINNSGTTLATFLEKSLYPALCGLTLEQDGAASVPAEVTAEASFDGLTWVPVGKLKGPTSTGAVSSRAFPTPRACSLVRFVYTQATGGTSTFSARVSSASPFAVTRSLIHTWASAPSQVPTDIMAIPEVMPMVRILMNSSGRTAEEYAEATVARVSAIYAAKGALGLPFRYSLFLQNFANRQPDSGTLDSPRLWSHPDDRYLPDADISRRTPFSAHGIAEAYPWSKKYAEATRSGLEQANLPFPTAVDMDVEGGSLLSSDGLPLDSGWFELARADSRAGTELFNGIHTLDEFCDTYWPTIQGEAYAFSADTSTNYFNQGANGRNNGTRMLDAITQSHQAYGLYEGHIKALIEVFPGIDRYSNYNNISGDDVSTPILDRSKLWSVQYGAPRIFTHESPVLYPLKGSSFQGSATSKADWVAFVGYTLTGDDPTDFSEVYRRATKITVDGLVDLGRLVVPWIPYFGYDVSVGSSIQWGNGYTHFTSVDDLLSVTTTCAEAGIREVLFWHPELTPQQWAGTREAMLHFISEVDRVQNAPVEP
jgi:hypothetical protein